MTQNTNNQIAAEALVAENRVRASLQTILVMSVALIATTLIGVTSLASMGV